MTRLTNAEKKAKQAIRSARYERKRLQRLKNDSELAKNIREQHQQSYERFLKRLADDPVALEEFRRKARVRSARYRQKRRETNMTGKRAGRGRPPRILPQEMLDKLIKLVNEYHAQEGRCTIARLAERHNVPAAIVRSYLIKIGARTTYGEYIKPSTMEVRQPMTDPQADVVVHPSDVLTNISKENKKAIRVALETNFNEEAGVYRTGTSDQEIARTLDVPWAAVARIREEFFGPLKADPDVAALRIDLEGLRHQIANFTTTDLDEWLKEFDGKMTELDQWRKELGDWRAIVAKEREEVGKVVVRLQTETSAISDKLAKLERRFG